jgi:hypothetical protein
MLEKYEEFKKRNIANQKKSSQQKIKSEKQKITVLNKKKVDGEIKQKKQKKQELQKKISSFNNVGGGNYYK